MFPPHSGGCPYPGAILAGCSLVLAIVAQEGIPVDTRTITSCIAISLAFIWVVAGPGDALAAPTSGAGAYTMARGDIPNLVRKGQSLSATVTITRKNSNEGWPRKATVKLRYQLKGRAFAATIEKVSRDMLNRNTLTVTVEFRVHQRWYSYPHKGQIWFEIKTWRPAIYTTGREKYTTSKVYFSPAK